MSGQEIARVLWHLDMPVCRTLGGIKRHVALIGLGDCSLLIRYFGCGIGELIERFWRAVKDRPRRLRDCRNCNGQAGGCRVDGLCEELTPLEMAAVRRDVNAE